MSLEGELRVGLHTADGRITRVRIESTRPDVARLLLTGRSRSELLAAVPRLFSLCARSQAAASRLACAAAATQDEPAAELAAARRELAAETLREAAWTALLHWPRKLGEVPAPDAVAAARLAAAEGVSPESRRAIAQACFGLPAAQWLHRDTAASLRDWATTGTTAAARFLHRALEQDVADGQAGVALLPPRQTAATMSDLAQALQQQADFARQPDWRGEPAETGALARHQQDAAVTSLLADTASRAPARLLARLRELALLLDGAAEPEAGTLALGGGQALAWVENARGLLVHQVALDGERVQCCRIVAPTEWNFHPRGALARALTDTPVAGAAQARARAERLIHTLDPCVACHVEIDHA